jgi:hypothetical protein
VARITFFLFVLGALFLVQGYGHHSINLTSVLVNKKPLFNGDFISNYFSSNHYRSDTFKINYFDHPIFDSIKSTLYSFPTLFSKTSSSYCSNYDLQIFSSNKDISDKRIELDRFITEKCLLPISISTYLQEELGVDSLEDFSLMQLSDFDDNHRSSFSSSSGIIKQLNLNNVNSAPQQVEEKNPLKVVRKRKLFHCICNQQNWIEKDREEIYSPLNFPVCESIKN